MIVAEYVHYSMNPACQAHRFLISCVADKICVTVGWICGTSAEKELQINIALIPIQPSGHYMYRQFNIQQIYVLPTQFICVFRVDLRTNSHYFPIQH